MHLVRPEFQGETAVGLPRAGAQDEDRDPFVALIELERAAHLVAIHAWQHEVQHHEVRHRLAGEREALLAVAGLQHIEPFGLEAELEHGQKIRLIVDNENARLGLGHPVPRG